MLLRTAAAVSVLVIGLVGSAGPVLAQFFPQFQPPPVRPLPPVAVEDDDVAPYDPPPVYGRRAPVYRGEVESNALPPPGVYREPPPGYEPVDPRVRVGRPNYNVAPPQDDGLRPPKQPVAPPRGAPPPPPMSIGPGQQGEQVQPGRQEPVYASLPPEERPEV